MNEMNDMPCALCGAPFPQNRRDFEFDRVVSRGRQIERHAITNFKNIPLCDKCAGKADLRRRVMNIGIGTFGVMLVLCILPYAIASLRDILEPYQVLFGVVGLTAGFVWFITEKLTEHWEYWIRDRVQEYKAKTE